MVTLFEFEEKYKDILENIEEWAFLRRELGFYLNNQIGIKNELPKKSKSKAEVINRLKNIFFGFKNWFGKYDYLFFSDFNLRKKINNKYKDKNVDDIIDRLKNFGKKSLLIESNSQIDKNIYTQFIVSDTIIRLISRGLVLIIKNRYYKNKENIEKIFYENNINLNYNANVKLFISYEIIYKILLKIYKPKKVFISCYYCRLPLVKVCHDLNIEVIDIQHGVISKEHFGYVSKIKINDRYIADKLLSFGLNEQKIPYLLIKNIYPIGNYYLNYLKNNFKFNDFLLEQKKKYKYLVGISMQDLDWEYEEMLNFINKLANKHKEILFILIPRKRDIDIKKLGNSNIIVFNKLDCYNTILHCDIHMTLYSSCALEAPSLGIPNILVDIKGRASAYYNDLLSKIHTKIISLEDDFLPALKMLVKLEKSEIVINNSDVFINDYEKNIDSFLRSLNAK